MQTQVHNEADKFRLHHHQAHIAHWAVDPQFDEMGMAYFDWSSPQDFAAIVTGHRI